MDEDPANNDPDNLVPLCFDCHSALHHYSAGHPRGTKYRVIEITTRRDQIYERYTRRYLRRVHVRMSNFAPSLAPSGRDIPMGDGTVSCQVTPLSDDLPIRLQMILRSCVNDRLTEERFGPPYDGEYLWNLNAGGAVFGNFHMNIDRTLRPFQYRVCVFRRMFDVVNRPHSMLPVSYVLNRHEPDGDWWFDPHVPREVVEPRWPTAY